MFSAVCMQLRSAKKTFLCENYLRQNYKTIYKYKYVCMNNKNMKNGLQSYKFSLNLIKITNYNYYYK